MEIILADDHAPKAIAQARAVLTLRRDLDANFLEAAGNLELIVICGPAGAPEAPRVALETARRLGIYVASIPDLCAEAWAEAVMLQIRCAAQGLGREARHLRLGLVGLGVTGRLVAASARDDGFLIGAADPFCAPQHFRNLGVQPLPLIEQLGWSQIAVVLVPLGPATRHLIDASTIGLMQRGSTLINGSDPELVAPEAIHRAGERQRPERVVQLTPQDRPLPPAHAQWSHAAGGGLQISLIESCTGEATRDEAIRRGEAIARRTLAGGRPPHLLIDPPCPRLAVDAPGDLAAL